MDLMKIYSVPFWQSEYPDFEEHQEFFLETIRKYKEENTSENDCGYKSQKLYIK